MSEIYDPTAFMNLIDSVFANKKNSQIPAQTSTDNWFSTYKELFNFSSMSGSQIDNLLGSVGTAVSGVINSYFSTATAKENLKAQADAYEFKAQIADINAQGAKSQMYHAYEQGEIEAANYGLRAQQTIGTTRARQGASGVKIGVGSSGEISASQKWSAERDIWSLSMNTLSQAQAFRQKAFEYGMEAQANRLSAANIRSSAKSLNPSIAALTAGIRGFASILNDNKSILGEKPLDQKQNSSVSSNNSSDKSPNFGLTVFGSGINDKKQLKGRS